MKKIISILLLSVLVFSVAACKKEDNTSSELDTSVQSDVSSTGTLAESTTTSEENSTSTSSINTTPSNSTPSKTEEPKPTVVAGEYTVTFDYGYDNKKTTAKSKNYKVAKPGNPTREGYDFCGWYAENEETCWNFAGHVVTEDMTLTARWQERKVSNKSQETQSQETQSRETQSQEKQSQETQSQENQSQENQSQESSSIPS
jgi:uncharacterized repeat protein (TIGR02543 family)